MTDRQKKIDLVRKCLALATSPFENEARRAREKATELMKKWGLTEAEVRGGRILSPEEYMRGAFHFSRRPGIRITRIHFSTTDGTGTSTSNATYW